ncbi:sensor domain-containing protein [Mycolicibacterium sp.]|uniref:sensor domain-containing protein n=1 Tax=Mycolicibacterium sp. TaxID=2320850 RepID=UPI003D0C4B62
MTRRARAAGAAIAAAAAVAALGTGCTRTVENPIARPGTLASPITTGQVVDLLSPKVLGAEGNLFATAEPERCAGLGREVDPPFIDAHRPLATDGGHWVTDDGTVYVEEMVAVYRYDFDPAAALDEVRDAIAACGDTPLTITTMEGRSYVFDVGRGSGDAPPNSVLWTLRAVDWNCDNTFVAAFNAAIEITACGAAGGFDIAALAEEASKRIEALANTTA